MSLAKKLKMIVKGEPKPSFGTDPNDPWSTKANITESEANMLSAYLKSRGINPEFVSKDTKISHSKSGEFQKWKRDHMFDDPADTVSSVAREKMKAQREEVELDETKTLSLTPVEKRQKALNRAERLGTVVQHDGLKEAVDKEDTITFDIPLLIRMFEYAREDAKTDMDLHKVTEKLISIRDKGTLTMADYDFIVKLKESVEIMEKKDPCWTGYQMVGMKKKGGKPVPNCVPESFEDEHGIGRETPKNRTTALEKWRKGASERAKKHAEIQKNSGGMTSAIDRLEKHLNKEEVEQINELKKSTLDSYRDKAMASNKNAKKNREASEAGKDMSKGFADLHAKSNAIVKKRIKGLSGYLQRKHGMKPGYEDQRKTTNENTLDSLAATEAPTGPGEISITPAKSVKMSDEQKKQMSKSARIIKSLYKKFNMKEELYDHEKEDKSVATYGKKPKVQKLETFADKEDQAAMVLKGGKTLTGQTRDTLEIDPVMRKPNKEKDNNK